MPTSHLSGLPVFGPDGQPLDRVELRGIRATANHGVLVHERENPQEFLADVAIYLDTQPAAKDDALAATVNYAAVAQAVVRVLTSDPVNLIETLAEKVAAEVLDFPTVTAVEVVLHKPGAPLAVPTDDVSVSIRRDNVNKKPVQHVRFTPPVVYETPVEPAVTPEPAEPAPVALDDASPEPVTIEPVLASPVVLGTVPAESEPALESTTLMEPLNDAFNQEPATPVVSLLALGSNQGSSLEILRDAISALRQQPEIDVVEVGPLARTSPVGGPAGQEDFLNTVVEVETTLSPRELLKAVQQIETEFGRTREQDWGPRTLDIDIITYGNLIAADDELTIPHKLAHDRAFVLLPWSQLRPDAVLPGPGGGPVAPLAATAPDRQGVRWLRLDWLEPSPPEAETETHSAEPNDAEAFVPYTSYSQHPTEPGLLDESGPYPMAGVAPAPVHPEPQHPVAPAPAPEPFASEPAAGWPGAAPAPQPTPAPQPAPVPQPTLQPTPASQFAEPSVESPTLLNSAPVPAQAAGHFQPPAPVTQPPSAAIQHAWAPSVPAAAAEYPTFTGIMQGAPTSAQPGGPRVAPAPHHASSVPSHSLPTFTGDLRAESPLAARAERVPLLKPDDLEPPELSHPVEFTPADQIPPFSRPVPRQAAPAKPPQPETKVPSWDDILRG